MLSTLEEWIRKIRQLNLSSSMSRVPRIYEFLYLFVEFFNNLYKSLVGKGENRREKVEGGQKRGTENNFITYSFVLYFCIF